MTQGPSNVIPADQPTSSRAEPLLPKAMFFTATTQAILAGLLLVEIVIFSFFGTNFFSIANLFEVPRLSVELGLISLAMTLVIVTGGIDLSVGSLLGLCAVLFGKLTRDAGLPPYVAAVVTLGIGAAGGGLNALLITRLRIPPLIVTLGSLSFFRGIAEGITRGADNFTNFPDSFLYLGQGYIGPIPVQLPLLVVAAAVFWVALHRGVIGRSLSAIGYSPEGARYAGIPVGRRLAFVYVLSGFCSALAAVVYVARVGQAKADAGTGYELSAITAVVLGGTSIFGGRGSIVGTLLGLFALAVLQNGLRLSDGPPELAGILTGLLLLMAMAIDWTQPRRSTTATKKSDVQAEEFTLRNSQLAVLCVVMLLAAGIVAMTNVILVRGMQRETIPSRVEISAGQNGSPSTAARVAADPTPTKKITVAMMPKAIGNAYFVSCRKGAEQAAAELSVNLLWDGPTDTDPARQNEVVDTWITRGVDVIAVSVENRQGLSTVLRKARAKGIKVVTWDSDADTDARDFFVNQATPEGIGNSLMDNAAKAMGGSSGKFAIITSSLTAANQNTWIENIKKRMTEKYPQIELVTIRPCDDLQNKAFEQANTILNAHRDVKVLMAVCSPAVPGAAEAVKQSGRSDVKIVGLGLPNENKRYVHDGVTTGVVLWNTSDLGYLAVFAARDVALGALKPGDTSIEAGRLGKLEVRSDNVLLGTPFTFDKTNIDQFDF